jgi:hypothetical protein
MGSNFASGSLSADPRRVKHRRARGGLPRVTKRHHNRAVAEHPLQSLIDRPIPPLELPASDGSMFSFRRFVGERPLVLFFYLLNGTPG